MSYDEEKALERVLKTNFVVRSDWPKRPFLSKAENEARLGVEYWELVGDPRRRELAVTGRRNLVVFDQGKKTKEIVTPFEFHTDTVSLSPNNERVVLRDYGRLIQLDLATEKETASWSPGNMPRSSDFQYAHLGDERFVVFDRSSMHVYLLARRSPGGPLEIVAQGDEADGYSWQVSGGWVFVQNASGKLRVYGEKDGVFGPMATLSFPKRTYWRIYSEEGRTFIEGLDALLEVIGPPPPKESKKKRAAKAGDLKLTLVKSAPKSPAAPERFIEVFGPEKEKLRFYATTAGDRVIAWKDGKLEWAEPDGKKKKVALPEKSRVTFSCSVHPKLERIIVPVGEYQKTLPYEIAFPDGAIRALATEPETQAFFATENRVVTFHDGHLAINEWTPDGPLGTIDSIDTGNDDLVAFRGGALYVTHGNWRTKDAKLRNKAFRVVNGKLVLAATLLSPGEDPKSKKHAAPHFVGDMEVDGRCYVIDSPNWLEIDLDA
jgi:hypothetical protein